MACLAFPREYPYTELFCEGRYGGLFHGHVSSEIGRYLPEWGASLSAPFISLLGLIQLVQWQHDSGLLQVVSSLFVVNGWSALANHATGYSWWSFVDGMSMLLVVWMVMALVVEDFVKSMVGKSLRERGQEIGNCCRTLFNFTFTFVHIKS